MLQGGGKVEPVKLKLDEGNIPPLAILNVFIHHHQGFVILELAGEDPDIVGAGRREPLCERGFVPGGGILPPLPGRELPAGPEGKNPEAPPGKVKRMVKGRIQSGGHSAPPARARLCAAAVSTWTISRMAAPTSLPKSDGPSVRTPL